MTKDKFEEKYGDVELIFTHYYKYGFHFEGEADDGTHIRAYFGGNADDIYRYEVEPNKPQLVTNNIEMNWHRIVAINGMDKIFEYDDYAL